MDTIYRLLVSAHGLVGLVALVTFWLAAFAKKGSPLHVRTGKVYMVAMIGINAVLGFVIPGIAWQAHLGGLLVGAACAAVVAYTGHRRDPLAPASTRGRQGVHWLGLAAVTLVLVMAAVAKYALTNGYS